MRKINSEKLLISLYQKKRNMKHPFERELAGIESFEEWEYRFAQKAWSVFEGFLPLTHLFQDKVILDVGCGGGGKSLALLKYKPKELIGIDMDANFIEKAKQYAQQFEGNTTFVCADASHTSMQDASVDVVTLLDAFEHVSSPESILLEAHRILKPGGRVLISFPPYYHPQGAHVSDLIPFPWVHLFFTEEALGRAYIHLSYLRKDGEKRRKLKFKQEGEGWKMDYINYMTVKKAERILKKVDFQLKYFKLIPLRKIVAPLVKFKSTREFFIHTVAIVLEKDKGELE
jgi:2-polyprenyl-3-methyl-5-hydroxy-6-metoxy-1,4-benzoquinol methylase